METTSETTWVAVAFHSGYGHTARQAQAVVAGAADVDGVDMRSIDVTHIDDAGWRALDLADAIIFGAPTYMGSPSAGFKQFMEATSKAWGDDLRWKDKLAAGFTNSQNINGDKLNSLVSLAVFAAQHGMVWVSLGLYPGWNTTTASPDDLNRLGSFLGAMAQSNGDQGSDLAPPPSDLETARALGRRVAEAARRWRVGQATLAPARREAVTAGA